MPYSTLPDENAVKAAIAREIQNLGGAKEVLLAELSSFSPKTDDSVIGQNYSDGNQAMAQARISIVRGALQNTAANLRQIGDLFMAQFNLPALTGYSVAAPDPMPPLSNRAEQAAAIEALSGKMLADAVTIIDINPQPSVLTSGDARAIEAVSGQDESEAQRSVKVAKLLYIVASDMAMVSNAT